MEEHIPKHLSLDNENALLDSWRQDMDPSVFYM